MNEDLVYEIPNIMARLSQIEEEYRNDDCKERIRYIYDMLAYLSERIELLEKSIRNLCGVQDISDLI